MRILPTAAIAVALLTPATAGAQDAGDLPRGNLTIKSARSVDLANNVATLPLYKGTSGGVTVWYVVTDVSDKAIAQRMGLNFAPRLANAPRGCPSCVQSVSGQPGGDQAIKFAGRPDFSPQRKLVPGPNGFPPAQAAVGAMALPGYSPYVRVNGRGPVFNAPVVATGEGPFDVTTHSDTHDRLMAIDTTARTAGMLFIEGFSGGKPILYLQFDATDATAAVIERGTFTPALALISHPNVDRDPTTARAAIFGFANGPLGRSSPPAQGFAHVITDGRNAFDANLADRATIDALTAGGDAHNVLDVFPTNRRPLRDLYSPAWDLHISVWAPGVRKRTMTDADRIRARAEAGEITAPGGVALTSSHIELNCPVLAFVGDEPPR